MMLSSCRFSFSKKRRTSDGVMPSSAFSSDTVAPSRIASERVITVAASAISVAFSFAVTLLICSYVRWKSNWYGTSPRSRFRYTPVANWWKVQSVLKRSDRRSQRPCSTPISVTDTSRNPSEVECYDSGTDGTDDVIHARTDRKPGGRDGAPDRRRFRRPGADRALRFERRGL